MSTSKRFYAYWNESVKSSRDAYDMLTWLLAGLFAFIAVAGEL